MVLLTIGTALIHVNATEISLIVASLIIPFAVSSILVVMSKPEDDKVLKFSANIIAMIVGLVYIIAAVIMVAFVG